MPKRKKPQKPPQPDKRPRLTPPDPDSRGYIDPTTGQRGAFPGLDDTTTDFYGPAHDGLDYLKMVRSERKSVPTLLVANPNPRSDDPSSGWYHDGTYTARPAPCISAAATPRFHAAVLTRFVAMRERFWGAPPTPVMVVGGGLPLWRQRQVWQRVVVGTRPTPGMLAGLDQGTVLRVLGWATPMVKGHVRGWWGEWVWGGLVRVDTCLTGEEVSVVREVGKRCLYVRAGLVKGGWVEVVEAQVDDDGAEEVEGEGKPQLSEEDEEKTAQGEPDPEVEEGELELELEPAEPEEGELPLSPPINIEPIPPSPPPIPAKDNVKEHSYADTLAALDMVISIVGDFFGQRDLLAEREMQGW